MNTLRFASRALKIVNSAKVNIDDDNEARDNEALMKEVQLLRQQVQILQLRNDLYAKKAALGLSHATLHAAPLLRSSTSADSEDVANDDEEEDAENYMSCLNESMNMSAYDINLDEIEAWEGDEEYFKSDEEALKVTNLKIMIHIE